MKKRSIALLTALMFVGFGCGDSAPLDSSSTVGSSNALGTLSTETDNKKILMHGEWKSVKTDLKKYFYEREGEEKSYAVEMKFSDYKVEALANCYKLEASYLVHDKEVSFAKLSFSPAIEMASCVESEDAEDAVNVFFSQSYTVEKAGDSMLFTSMDGETKVTLAR